MKKERMKRRRKCKFFVFVFVFGLIRKTTSTKPKERREMKRITSKLLNLELNVDLKKKRE